MLVSVKVVFNALLLVQSHFQIVGGSFQNFTLLRNLFSYSAAVFFFSSSERRGLSLVVRKSNDFEPQQTSLQNSFPLFLRKKRKKLDTAIVFVNKFLLFVNGFNLSPPLLSKLLLPFQLELSQEPFLLEPEFWLKLDRIFEKVVFSRFLCKLLRRWAVAT